MTKQNDQLSTLEQLLQKMETDLARARRMLAKLQDKEVVPGDKSEKLDTDLLSENLSSYEEDDNIQVVEGVYDGYFMVGADKKKYPVPMNYASKSKLIPGDILKLRIMSDGKLLYKLIGQANKKYIKATLSKTDDNNKFTAITDDGQVFFLNQAAVTYFKGQTGDELSIIVNADGLGNFAAIEALIPQPNQSS